MAVPLSCVIPNSLLRNLDLKRGRLQYPFFYAIYSINAILFNVILSVPLNFFFDFWSFKPLAVFFQKLLNQGRNP